MDQTLINVIVGITMALGSVAMGALGWFARTLWDRVQEHSKEIADLRIKLAGEYVSSLELANTLNEFKTAVSGMFNDMKADVTYIRHRVDGLPLRRQGDPS